MTLRERFKSKYVVNAETGCWEWAAHRCRKGYGLLSVEDKTRQAHRVSYELFTGPIPDGLQLDHLCRVRHCVNPNHLEPVTARENTLRGNTLQAANAAKTHCPAGHPYDAANTDIRTNGARRCRACHRNRNRERARHIARAAAATGTADGGGSEEQP